jgi:hypothetical protein
MEMEIALGDEIIPVRGTVVRSHELENGSYYLGIEFDREQEKLASVVLEHH